MQCHECQTSWRDPINFSLFENFGLAIKNLLSMNSEHLNHLHNLLFEEPCPRCGVYIYREAGCNHMVCVRCKYEFCWWCLGSFVGYYHNYEKDGYRFCPYRYIAVVWAMIMCLLIYGFKLS